MSYRDWSLAGLILLVIAALGAFSKWHAKKTLTSLTLVEQHYDEHDGFI